MSSPPAPAASRLPLIVGIGGTPRPGSSSELALRLALASVADRARVLVFAGEALLLPLYRPGLVPGDARASALVEALAQCEGLVIASPAYHGSVSGLIKNALDYAEELSARPRPYLDGVPVGLIACAAGTQAASLTLSTLRTVTHALRGWPTPFGAAITTTPGLFADGECGDERARLDLERVAGQVLDLAQLRRSSRHPLAAGSPDHSIAGHAA